LSSISPAVSGFLDDSIDGRALHHACLLAKLCERFLESLDLLFGLFEMVLQAGDKVSASCLVDHLRQRFENLLFGVIDVLQTMD
jgi:hypothetical protein